jgi:hypothetical protein
MAHRLVLRDGLPPRKVHGTGFVADRTKVATVGTGLLVAYGLGLLFQEGGQGAFGQSAGGLPGDRLQGVEVGVQTGAVGPEGVAGHDFAPRGGQVTEFAEVFRAQLGTSHLACPFPLRSRLPTPSCPCRIKLEHASWSMQAPGGGTSGPRSRPQTPTPCPLRCSGGGQLSVCFPWHTCLGLS